MNTGNVEMSDMKIITTLELDPGCFLFMTEAKELENGTNLQWYIGSAEDLRRVLVRVPEGIALSLFSLRQTKNNDPLREDFDSDDWKSQCVSRYNRWIDDRHG